MRLSALLIFAALWSGDVLGAAPPGYVKVEPSSLDRVYGLRKTVRIAGERPLFAVHTSQQTAPLITADLGIVVVATHRGLEARWVESTRLIWRRTDIRDIGRGFAAQGGLLLVGSDTAVLGLDLLSGETRWQFDAGAVVAGPPTLAGAVAIVPLRPNAFAALSITDGKLIWRLKEPVNGMTVAGQATPRLTADSVVVGLSDGRVMALDRETGTARWSKNLSNPERGFHDVDATAVLPGGKNVVAASYSGGLYRLEMSTGAVLWHKPELEHIRAMNLVGDVLVLAVGTGEVIGVRPKDGTVLWRLEIPAPGAPIPVGTGSEVMVTSENGPMALIDARTGHPSQFLSGGSGVSAPPAIMGDELAFVTDRGLLLLYRRGVAGGGAF